MSRRPKAYCRWCLRPLEAPTANSNLAFTKDHVVPRLMGGKSWVPCCRLCNLLKGCMTPDEWRAWRDLHPRWWEMEHGEARRSMRPGLPKIVGAQS